MQYRHIKIPVQTLHKWEVDEIREFLLKQPKWRMTREDELGPRTNRYAKRGSENQHYLWMSENQVTSWDDFTTEWGHSKTPEEERWIPADRPHLIMPGELFLCDLVGGELWIGRLEHHRGRTRATKLHKISDDMNADYGNCFNGYARLPLKEIRQERAG